MRTAVTRSDLLARKLGELLKETDFTSATQEAKCYIETEPLNMERQALRQVISQAVDDLEDMILAMRLELIRITTHHNNEALVEARNAIEQFAKLVRASEGFEWAGLVQAVNICEKRLRALGFKQKDFFSHVTWIERAVEERQKLKYRMLGLPPPE
jgi:hypothetical protein